MRHTKPVKPARQISAKMIRRSVASSTAIETGQNIAKLERKLRAGSRRFHNLRLASR